MLEPLRNLLDEGKELEPETFEEVYQTLVRALRRNKGFGLFFVMASPAQARKVLDDLQEQNLPGKQFATVQLERDSEQLFDQLEGVWRKRLVDVFWIEGLDQALLGYEDVKRLMGWDETELLNYSFKGVPLILSHLNMGRERFRDTFPCSMVFVVPLFAVKYLIRRAPDFFDWKSGFFEFPDDQQKSVQQVINYATRLEKILRNQELLNSCHLDIAQRAMLLQETGQLFEAGKEYEQAISAYTQAIGLEPDRPSTWDNLGNALVRLGRYDFNHFLTLFPNHPFAQQMQQRLQTEVDRRNQP